MMIATSRCVSRSILDINDVYESMTIVIEIVINSKTSSLIAKFAWLWNIAVVIALEKNILFLSWPQISKVIFQETT